MDRNFVLSSLMAIILMCSTFNVYADNTLSETIDIEQVHGQPVIDAPVNDIENLWLFGKEDIEHKDYQQEILSNQNISDIARTKAITGSGGNTAVIIQDGDANYSAVWQSGNNNYARQTQNGDDNSIQLNQKGNHNYSDEKQTGKYNRKMIIQNGERKKTTIIEQVSEWPIKEDGS